MQGEWRTTVAPNYRVGDPPGQRWECKGMWGVVVGCNSNDVPTLLNSKVSHLPLTWSVVVQLLDAARMSMMVNDV